MKIIKVSFYILCMCSIPLQYLAAQCTNKMMNFSTSNDYIQSNLSFTNVDLWVDFWIKSNSSSTPTVCPSTQGELFLKIEDIPTDFIGLSECGGVLQVLVENPTGSTIDVVPSTNIRNGWSHIQFGLIYDSVSNDFTLELYIDCILVWTKANVPKIGFNKLTLGNDLTNSMYSKNFIGDLDEFKLSYKRLPCSNGYACKEDLSIPLIDYLRFDEGIDSGNNTSLIGPKNTMWSGNTYTFYGFNLNGNTSNYICSTTPIVYPDLTSAKVEIKDYPFRNMDVLEICSGDPVHFCLDTTSLKQIPLGLVDVSWESNNGSGWNTLSPTHFNGFCFGVAPGVLTIDCSSNTLGYSSMKFRAVFKVYTDQAKTDFCTFISESTTLKICCEPDFQLDVMANGSTSPLCDQDNVNFDVKVISAYPFINNPSSSTTITYTYNGITLPSFANMNSFSLNQTVAASTGACFQATVTTPCGKTKTMNACIPVDVMPKCGTIIGSANPPNLDLISSSPLVYEICPGDDAAIEIDNAFQDCIPHWQYSFDGLSGWTDLGIGNSVQNTNILPTGWPGNKIFYRIECKPLNDPSGCDPCYSNLIEVNLKGGISAGSISGAAQFCRGKNNLLTLTGHDPSANLQWYCNGNMVGNGTATLQATQAGCYWVESTDTTKCSQSKTPLFCTEICDLEIKFKTTTCMKEGDNLIIDACDSFDSCGLPLTYTWYIDGVVSTQTSCVLNDVMGAIPKTYKLVLTNSIGCTTTKSITLTPCP